jgi:RNAse (barnase) inhibitor barstar
MSKERLYLPEAPYLHIIGAGISEITDFGLSLVEHDLLRVVVRFLRGKKMARLSSLYDEFAAALQFPYYFGENWNAFDECITDLEWMPADVYVLVITNAKNVLADESDDQLEALTNLLEEAGSELSLRFETSEASARPAVAFHVVFQCDESDKQAVMSRLQSVGASVQEIFITGPSHR